MILRKIKSPQQKFKWLNTEFPWAFPMSLGKWQCGQNLSILSFLELPDLANKKTGQKKASKQRERRAWPRLCFRWIINNSYMTVPKVLHGTCSAIWNAAITQLFFFFFSVWHHYPFPFLSWDIHCFLSLRDHPFPFLSWDIHCFLSLRDLAHPRFQNYFMHQTSSASEPQADIRRTPLRWV